MLKNEPTLAIRGVDTAENEPCKVCPLSVYRSPRSFWDGRVQARSQRDCFLDDESHPREQFSLIVGAPFMILSTITSYAIASEDGRKRTYD